MKNKQNTLSHILLNEKIILPIIFLNAIMIYLQESNYHMWWIVSIDVICTCIFIMEMVCKHVVLGAKKYWSSGWNRLDGILVILSLPSIVNIFIPTELTSLSFLLILRVLRVFRFFRIFHLFPNFTQIAQGFIRALKQSYAIFVGLAITIVVFAVISCAIYKDFAPDYFANPTDSIYSIFRLFTIEGWYEIPDAIANTASPAFEIFTRIYFALILIIGGIIGVSLINTVFINAMISDNNEELEKKITIIEEKIDRLLEK